MGMGNYLTMTTDLTWGLPERLPGRTPELTVDRKGRQRDLRSDALGREHCTLAITPDGLLMAVHAGDCLYVFVCDDCGAESCVGCGQQVVIDLDEQRVRCIECNGRDIWAEVRYRYGEGRRRVGLAQAPPEC